MSTNQPSNTNSAETPLGSNRLPEGETFRRYIARRRTIGTIWRGVFFTCTVVGLVALTMLLYNIVNESFGLVAVQTEVALEELTGGPDRTLEELSTEELATIVRENVRRGRVRALERDAERPIEEFPKNELVDLVREDVLREEIVESWPLREALFNREAIEAEMAEEFPRAELQFRAWINWDFVTSRQSSNPAIAGVRSAIIGSLWMITITMLVAFPIGVGTAIYLQEYATDNWFNRIIQTNINNLAGVPSIVYGLLGLAVFVRFLGHVTSGAFIGANEVNPEAARTILSAALTMALLILPLIIINAQEAIRAVPSSLRQASLALGATRWQTVWNHVLPSAFPGILTGTILAMSRAIGETAPLVVIGAATTIFVDPSGPFSRFTALPIQIFQWTARPQDQFRDIAAAAIIVLLIMLLSLNSLAVYLRYRFQRYR